MGKAKKTPQSMKREQIIRNAERLFSRFGSKRLTVEEICREAGVSKMTFYKYFPNKVGLVRVIRDRWVEEGFQKFDEINAMDIPFPEKINLMTRWKVEFASRLHTEFIRELVSIDDVMERSKRRFLQNMTRAQQDGEIRPEIDLQFLWLVIEKLQEMAKEEAWKVVFSDFGQFQEQLRNLIFFGLLTQKPDKGGGAERGGERGGKK
jgi:AcrR family transcriptional regulator